MERMSASLGMKEELIYLKGIVVEQVLCAGGGNV